MTMTHNALTIRPPQSAARAVALGAGLLLLAALPPRARAAAAPLARLDFVSGEASNMRIVGDRPPTVRFDGGEAAELSRGRVAMPISWPADLPNPTFPGGVGEAGAAPEDPKSSLVVLDLDQKALGLSGPTALAFLVRVYDVAEGNSRNSNTTFSWHSNDPKRPTGTGKFSTCGSPYAADLLYRPRWLTKTVVASGIVLDDAVEGGDLKLQADSRVLISSIEAYALPASTLDPAVSRRAEGLISYPRHRAPESILDLWVKDLSDAMVQQAAAYAAWVDAEDQLKALKRHSEAGRGGASRTVGRLTRQAEALREEVYEAALRADAFFYQGKAALVRQNAAEYERLLGAMRDSLAVIPERAAVLECETREARAELRARTPSAALPAAAAGAGPVQPAGGRPSPADRIIFTTFANSPWDYWDPFNGFGRFLAYYGMDIKGYLLGGPQLTEAGALAPASIGHMLARIADERSRGFDVAVGVGHHDKHLTSPSFPQWLRKRAGKQSLDDVTAEGKPLPGKMDMWNPLVREYVRNVCTAFAHEITPNPHVHPWFYWGEPLCGTGYSVFARQAFREYLAERYGDVAALNAAWGAEYASLEDVAPPPPPGAELRTRAAGLTYEFENFRRESFCKWWQGIRAALRKGHPEARLWLEGWGRYDYLLRHGMDQLGLFEASDISSSHTGSMGQDAQRPWQLALSKYSGTPQVDGEINIYGPYYNGFANLEQLRAAAECHVLMQCWYGVRQFMFWGGQFTMRRVYSYGGPCPYNSSHLAPISPSGLAVRTVRKKADLYNDIIRTTSPVEPEVGILYSSTSFVNSWPYNEVEHETYPLHGFLFQADCGYRIVHEDAIADGREDLHSLRVLLAPWAAWLKPEAAQQILAWIENGGVLVSSGPIAAFDPIGRPLNTILEPCLGKVTVTYAGHERRENNRLSDASLAFLREIGDLCTTHFGGWTWDIARPEPRPEARALLAFANGDPAVFEAPLGYGKAVIATGPLGKNGMRRLIMHEIEQRVMPLVRKGRDDGFHVLPRADARSNLYLGVFNQDVSEAITDTLVVRGAFPQVSEISLDGVWPVPAEVRDGATEITLTLAPGEAAVLRLGSLFAARRTPRDLQARTAPASDPGSPSLGEIEAIRAEVERSNAPPRLKGERLALLLAAERHLSAGYYERAGRLAAQARELRELPEIVSFPEDHARASRCAKAVVVDGQAGEWKGVPRYAVRNSADSGGEFAFQWSDEFLYVLAVVRDPALKDPEEKGGDYNWIWAYDGVLLVLNAAHTAPLTAGGALYDAKYRAAQTALLVSISGRKYANSACGFSAAPVRSAVGKLEGGYVMELAVPMRDVMLPPLPDAEVGFEFKIVNNGRRMGFARFSDREDWSSDPLVFARLLLAP